MGTDLVPFEPPASEQYTDAVPHIKKGKEGGGRGSLLDDPELIELFARGVADGWPTSKFMEMFHISDRTVRNYKKDPRVRHAALKFQQERVLLITSRTDREIERRLLDSHEIDTVDLIRLRKEFLGGLMRIQAENGAADERTVADAMDVLEGDPEMAAKLLDVLGGRAPKETKVDG